MEVLPLLTAAGCSFVLAACTSSQGNSSASGDASGAPPAGPGQSYETLMVGYAAESGQAIDPMMFVSAPRSPAGVGGLGIRHVAGVAPVKRTDPAGIRLVGADGTPLPITLGQWERAAGTVSFTCVDGREQAKSTLTGLVPSASYSVFAVHADVQGPGRFTPWGDRAGTTNNFTASATGTAARTDTVDGCVGEADDIIVIWHSDGATHGPRPGRIGVDWHTSLIRNVP